MQKTDLNPRTLPMILRELVRFMKDHPLWTVQAGLSLEELLPIPAPVYQNLSVTGNADETITVLEFSFSQNLTITEMSGWIMGHCIVCAVEITATQIIFTASDTITMTVFTAAQ